MDKIDKIDKIEKMASSIMKEYKKGLITDIEYRNKCKNVVLKYLNIQTNQLERMFDNRNKNLSFTWVKDKLIKQDKGKIRKIKFVIHQSRLSKMINY